MDHVRFGGCARADCRDPRGALSEVRSEIAREVLGWLGEISIEDVGEVGGGPLARCIRGMRLW